MICTLNEDLRTPGCRTPRPIPIERHYAGHVLSADFLRPHLALQKLGCWLWNLASSPLACDLAGLGNVGVALDELPEGTEGRFGLFDELLAVCLALVEGILE